MGNDDMELVRQFVTSQSESAFAALVSRYTNLVYSAAFRRVENSQLAEEITQAVFTILAQKADTLNKKTVLSGWLYRAACYVSGHAIKQELRRQRREQEAYMQSLSNQAEPEVWSQITPLLEDAMMRLGKAERDALILRFFEGHSLKEAGTTLGTSEAAIKMRVNRALEKLRVYFSRHGVNSTAETIAGAMSANFVMVAPPTLAKMSTAVALAKGATASTSTLTLVKGALKVMTWSKTKTTVVGVAIALLGIGGIIGTKMVVDTLLPVPDIQGTWDGTADLPGYGIHKGESAKIPIVLRITRVNGAYQASMENMGLGQDMAFDTFTYKHLSLHGEITAEDTSFAGEVDCSGKKMSLQFREKRTFTTGVFKRTANPPPFPEPLTDAEFAPRPGSDLQGFWAGKLGSGKTAIRFQVKIAEASDGTFRADLYVPDQNNIRQPTEVSYDGTTVKLMPMDGLGMFEGKLRNGGKEMTGDWMQAGLSMPTTITQTNYFEFKAHEAK